VKPPNPELVRALGQIVGEERVLSRPIDRIARSIDASIYRLIPEVVVRPRDLRDMKALFSYARDRRRHLTLRTAGTSLSGQAVTDGILVELAPCWKAAEILDGGKRVRSQPGVVGGHLNRRLAPLGYRIGPDPASIDSAMMGGILANNSSGMCCGVSENSYHTLESLAFLLADGTVVDTASADAAETLRRDNPAVHDGLVRLRDEVRGNAVLAERIRRKFARKNTTGYSLNAFLDFDRPVDILAHLMVGSEGTLAFVSEMTLKTIQEMPARATGLLYFSDLAVAGGAVVPLAQAGAAAIEIMDAACLRSGKKQDHPFPIGKRTSAILAEFRAADPALVQSAVARAQAALGSFRLLTPVHFTTDSALREQYWRVRKGLVSSVGALRPAGTAVVTEDIAIPPERLAEAITDLQALLERNGFSETGIFGHAKDGNLHFVMAQDFSTHQAVERYERFMEGLVELVVGRFDGALKAEHGSGRNMAPFVRVEWGTDAYDVMRRTKKLLDPFGILNPGVVLNDDLRVHLKDLKPLPTISPLADRCIECGFCEQRCPSRDLTLTPRQRIAVVREMTRLGSLGTAEAEAMRGVLRSEFSYEGIVTCAGDSMCQTSCPVEIDTGALMKELKAQSHSRLANRLAYEAAGRVGAIAGACRLGLRAASRLRELPAGRPMLDAATGLLHALLPDLVPRISPDLDLPRPAPRLARASEKRADRVVYFPSCLTRILGPLPDERSLPMAEAMLDVLSAAQFSVAYPEGIEGLCCGMPFLSKGFPKAARRAAARTAEALWSATRGGRDCVVTDASPCAGTLSDLSREVLAETKRAVAFFDFTAFWASKGLPAAPKPPRRIPAAVLHPTCTLVKSGGLPALVKVAQAYSDEVVVPAFAECCGFAGDRGFLVPELTASATSREAEEVRQRAGGRTNFYSTCRTCELGMTRAVGSPYRSMVQLVHEALFPAP